MRARLVLDIQLIAQPVGYLGWKNIKNTNFVDIFLFGMRKIKNSTPNIYTCKKKIKKICRQKFYEKKAVSMPRVPTAKCTELNYCKVQRKINSSAIYRLYNYN